jgi:hypothetical protein
VSLLVGRRRYVLVYMDSSQEQSGSGWFMAKRYSTYGKYFLVVVGTLCTQVP